MTVSMADINGALRQYRSNNSDEFVFGYDIKDMDAIIEKIVAERSALINVITECTDQGEFDGKLLEAYLNYYIS
tara:strand:- start:113 stop:334 length:222 start_codon:yes stop_codon:yes gene_type:complete